LRDLLGGEDAIDERGADGWDDREGGHVRKDVAPAPLDQSVVVPIGIPGRTMSDYGVRVSGAAVSRPGGSRCGP
jgi:hypothetical protein